eukprot:6214791-Pleurochrysis_carterae.AAC.12
MQIHVLTTHFRAKRTTPTTVWESSSDNDWLKTANLLTKKARKVTFRFGHERPAPSGNLATWQSCVAQGVRKFSRNCVAELHSAAISVASIDYSVSGTATIYDLSP